MSQEALASLGKKKRCYIVAVSIEVIEAKEREVTGENWSSMLRKCLALPLQLSVLKTISHFSTLAPRYGASLSGAECALLKHIADCSVCIL